MEISKTGFLASLGVAGIAGAGIYHFFSNTEMGKELKSRAKEFIDDCLTDDDDDVEDVVTDDELADEPIAVTREVVVSDVCSD